MSKTSPPKIEIDQLIDQRRLSGLQVGVIVLCAMVVLLDGYDLQTMALAVPLIATKWSLHSSGFGLALSAALVGYAFGASLLAPLGDRWGRRPLLILAMLLIGVSSIGTAFSANLTQLVVWRFLTGLWLGASLPNATALTSEFVPARRRAALVTLMYCNVAVGAFTAGFVAPPIVAAFGWPGIFMAGGVVPLALSVLLFFAAPESVRYLVAQRPQDPRIGRILARIAPEIDPSTVYAAESKVQRQSVVELLAPLYRARTILLWSVYCLNSFVLYLLISWLPTLLTGAGWSAASASKGGVMIQAGGIVGGLLLSWGVDRGKTVFAMVSAYVVTAAGLGLFAVVPSSAWGWWVLLLVIGGGTSGAQFALNALSTAFYPPVIRATGVGWALAVARIGAIASPLIGGWLVQMRFEAAAVLGLLIVPVLICAASVSLLPRVWRPA